MMVGWRVPDGGSSGVWSTALGSSSYFSYTYDSTNEGMNFSDKFGTESTIWYPASGNRNYSGGGLKSLSDNGNYWSVTPSGSNGAYHLFFRSDGYVAPSYGSYRASGYAVRCLQESK